MVELEIYIVDQSGDQRVLLDTVTADSSSTADIVACARARIVRVFRLHKGLCYTPPILLKQRSQRLQFGVIWKDNTVQCAQYDLYEVDVASDEPITASNAVLTVSQITFRNEHASKRRDEILRDRE